MLCNDRTNLKIVFLRLLPSILVLKAFFLSAVSLGVCDLVNVTIPPSMASHYDNMHSFGLYSYAREQQVVANNNLNATSAANNSTSEIEFIENVESEIVEELGSCHELNLDWMALDGKFSFARICGITTVAVGLLAAIAICCHAFSSVSKRTWRMAGVAVFACGIMESLTLLLLRSDFCSGMPGFSLEQAQSNNGNAMDDTMNTSHVESTAIQCELGGGSEAIIGGIVFWAATVVSMLFVPSNLDYSWVLAQQQRTSVATAENDDEFDDTMDDFDFDDERGEYEMSSAMHHFDMEKQTRRKSRSIQGEFS